jgi:hypothetical protein
VATTTSTLYSAVITDTVACVAGDIISGGCVQTIVTGNLTLNANTIGGDGASMFTIERIGN